MISKVLVLELHQKAIALHGGDPSVRDNGMLESAIHRPWQTFGGQPLYDTPVKQAAALLESMVVNHPFTDGNKRTGYLLYRRHLLKHDLDIAATQAEKYAMVIAVADGTAGFEEIVRWTESRLVRL